MINKLKRILIIICLPITFFGQQKKHLSREYYFSWGYNTEWYTHSNLKISQPDLGNNYVFENVLAHDRRGWDKNLLHKNFTIPQYNYRIGYFLPNHKNLAIEINFDHTKYIIANAQAIHQKGIMNNKPIDTFLVFSLLNGDYYFLNNGANFLLFNIVKRCNLIESTSKKFKLDGLGKAGLGPLIPHVENSLFGMPNTPQFQFGGWNTGVEAALRATFFKHGFLEYTNKLDYAFYSGLHVFKGKARQSFGTYEMILNIGYTF